MCKWIFLSNYSAILYKKSLKSGNQEERHYPYYNTDSSDFLYKMAEQYTLEVFILANGTRSTKSD